MLAKVLANPGSLLILDEPTNDLDMDTLDMIQEILSDYKGTLIVVSHDRDFLDRIVTKSLIFDGQGGVEEFYGSYLDYIAMLRPKAEAKATKKLVVKQPSNKLSFKVKHELETIPKLIDELEIEIKSIEAELEDPELYSKNQDKFLDLSQKVVNKKAELGYLWERWSELEA
jgi:ATP-binding cassette subfamily F protein uup